MSIFEVLGGAASSFAGFSVLHTLLPNFFLYFPFLISRHNVLSCLAHYWTLILSENFWLDWIFDSTLLLLAIVPKCKIHAVPSCGFDWKMRFLMIWPQKRKCWFDFRNHAHTHRAHTIRSKKIFKLLMLLLLNLMYKVSERFCERKMPIYYCDSYLSTT